MKDMIKTKDAKKGGYLVGKPHSEGGIKGINVDTGEPIEVEGGEVVITKPAVDATDKYNFEGKMMTPKEIMSELNSSYGGVSFKKGGEVPSQKFDDGGIVKGLIDSGEALERYTRRGGYTMTSNDDIDYDVCGKKINSIDLEKNQLHVEFKGSDSTLTFPTAITEGDYILLKYYFYINTYSYKINNIIEYPPNFWLPFQVKKITPKNDNPNKLKEILLCRELNGIYQEVIVSESLFYQDSYVFIPNFMADLPSDFRDTKLYIPPAENKSGLSDNWMIGKPCLSYMPHIKGISSAVYLYSLYNPLYDPTNTDNIGLISTVRVDNGFVEYFIPRYLDQHNYAIQNGQQKRLMLMEGDVIDMGLPMSMSIYSISDLEKNDLTLYSHGSAVAEDISTLTQETRTKAKENDYGFLRDCKILGFQTNMPIGALDTTISAEPNYKPYTEPSLDFLYFEYNGEEYAVDDATLNYIVIYEYKQFAENKESTLTETEQKINRKRRKQQGENPDLGFVADVIETEISKLNVLRGLVDKKNIAKLNEIDKKVAELRERRDLLLLKKESPLTLLDRLATINSAVKVEEEMPDRNLLSINGQPSMLTEKQWNKVRTENFIDWFGDWMTAYQTRDYSGVSKVINETTKEPLVVYHGSKADFVRWRFNRFPAAYFAENRSYAEWFANVRGEGELYQLFIDMKNPLDMRQYGVEEHTVQEYLDYLLNTYDIPYEATAILKEYQRGGQQRVNDFLNAPMYFWSFIRHFNQSLLVYLRDKTFYDGIIMYENNPQDIIDGEENVTASYVVFREEQIKWASAVHFNTIIKDQRYSKGGLTKEEIEYQKKIDLLKNTDFVL